MTRVRTTLLLLTMLLLATSVPQSAHADDALKAVLQQLAGIEALSARFHEEKRMALLAQPLASEGALYYGKPRMLLRQTERPRPTSVLLRGDTLSFGDDKHVESIELSRQPALAVLVETFVSVLAGDLAKLERVATLSLESRADGGYRIRVLPKDEKVKRLVRTMTFEGKGALLSRMELVDATGDVTNTTFTNVTVRKSFSKAEQAKIFRVGGR